MDFRVRATFSQALDLKFYILFQDKFPAFWEAYIGREENLSLASQNLPPGLNISSKEEARSQIIAALLIVCLGTMRDGERFQI